MSQLIWITIGASIVSLVIGIVIGIVIFKVRQTRLRREREVTLQSMIHKARASNQLSGGIGNTATSSSPITNIRRW